jgi:DNA-binding SARP family transcriptional activator
LLQADPWREDIVRGSMAVRYAGGDGAGVLAEFDRFARLLRAEMNASPMPETLVMREAIIRNAEPRQADAASHANDPVVMDERVSARIDRTFPSFGGASDAADLPLGPARPVGRVLGIAETVRI